MNCVWDFAWIGKELSLKIFDQFEQQYQRNYYDFKMNIKLM